MNGVGDVIDCVAAGTSWLRDESRNPDRVSSRGRPVYGHVAFSMVFTHSKHLQAAMHIIGFVDNDAGVDDDPANGRPPRAVANNCWAMLMAR